MPDSDRLALRYLGLMAAAAALLLSGAAGLNLAMDPYSTELGRWWRLRGPTHDTAADHTPDAGTAARIAAVARSSAPTLIVGTSRVQTGFGGNPAQIFNAGQPAATLEETLRVAEAAATRPSPPRFYLVETTGLIEIPVSRARTGLPSWPSAADRLLAREASHVSLHLLGHALGRGQGIGRLEDFHLPIPPPAEPKQVKPLTDSSIEPALHPGSGAPETRLHAALERLFALCARNEARLALVQLPVHPTHLGDPRVARVISVRFAAYRTAAAAVGPRYPRCRATLVEASGFSAGSSVPAARDPRSWIDRLHFLPNVGAALLQMVAEGELPRS